MCKYTIMESGSKAFQNNDFRKLISDFILKEYKNIRGNFSKWDNISENYKILTELLSYLYKEVKNERDYFNQVYQVLEKWDSEFGMYGIELIINKEVSQ